MIKVEFKPMDPSEKESLKPQLDPIIQRIMAVLKKPRLQVDPTTPPIIQVTKEVISAMSQNSQPILVLPGSIIQCYVPEISRIVTLIFGVQNAIQVQITDVATTLVMDTKN